MKTKDDKYSPNGVLATCCIALVCFCLLCGQSLWVPASRIGNLYLRSIMLAVTDAISAFAAHTGLDQYEPVLRSSFISATDLASHSEWDTRYYHSRNISQNMEPVASAVPTESEPPTALSVPEAPEILSETNIPSESANTDATAIDSSEMSGTDISPHLSVPETAVAETMSPQPTDSLIHSRTNPLRVFVFGDSQVFSIGAGLSRLVGKDSSIYVDFLPIHSSGFIRGDYYNWPTKLEDTFSTNSYEAAVMMLGMNDYQNFWDDEGEIMKKRTPEWEAAYKEKCRRIIDIVLASVPRLYWLGMPMVKNSVYNESLIYIDSIQQSLAEEYSPDVLVRVPLKDTIPGVGKSYTNTMDVTDGKTIRVMSDDGTHFTVPGGQLVMKPLFDRLSRDYLFNEVPVAHLPE